MCRNLTYPQAIQLLLDVQRKKTRSVLSSEVTQNPGGAQTPAIVNNNTNIVNVYPAPGGGVSVGVPGIPSSAPSGPQAEPVTPGPVEPAEHRPPRGAPEAPGDEEALEQAEPLRADKAAGEETTEDDAARVVGKGDVKTVQTRAVGGVEASKGVVATLTGVEEVVQPESEEVLAAQETLRRLKLQRDTLEETTIKSLKLAQDHVLKLVHGLQYRENDPDAAQYHLYGFWEQLHEPEKIGSLLRRVEELSGYSTSHESFKNKDFEKSLKGLNEQQLSKLKSALEWVKHEGVMSHFDFDAIDPIRDSEIKSSLDYVLRSKRDLRSNIYTTIVDLQNSGTIEAFFSMVRVIHMGSSFRLYSILSDQSEEYLAGNLAFGKWDALVANLKVLQLARERKLLLGGNVDIPAIFSEGTRLIYYLDTGHGIEIVSDDGKP